MAITREASAKRSGDPGVAQLPNSSRDIWVETTHVGAVVETGQTYLYDGEYTYWAVVANPDGSFEQIHYGSTYPGYSTADVDAPAAAMAAWTTEKALREAEARKRAAEHAAETERYEAEQRARTPRRGSIVRVVKGRKVPIGTEGTVFWAGDSTWGLRIGLDFGGQREFISADNVEVLSQTTP